VTERKSPPHLKPGGSGVDCYKYVSLDSYKSQEKEMFPSRISTLDLSSLMGSILTFFPLFKITENES
jgi:hypothetical protein